MRRISGVTVLIGVTVPASGCTDQRIYDSPVCSHGNVFAFIMVVHKAGISTKIERIEYETPLRVIFMFKSATGFAELRPEACLKYRG